MHLIVVVNQVSFLIFFDEECNLRLILNHDLILVDDGSTFLLLIKLNGLDRHHRHEEVSRVAELGAWLANATEIING